MSPINFRVELELAARNLIAARIRRDNWIVNAVESGVLTRQEIADAVGLAKSRVDQIARGYSCRANVK